MQHPISHESGVEAAVEDGMLADVEVIASCLIKSKLEPEIFWGKLKDPNAAFRAATKFKSDLVMQILLSTTSFFVAEMKKAGLLDDRLKSATMSAEKVLQYADGILQSGKRTAPKLFKIIKRLKPMVQGEYDPLSSENLLDLIDDLGSLYFIYKSRGSFGTFADKLSPPIQLMLDAALIEVVRASGTLCTTVLEKGKRRECGDRAAKKWTAISRKKKQRVIELYFRIDRKNLSKSAIARKIVNEWKRHYNEKPPSTSSIKNYLAESWSNGSVKLTKPAVLKGKTKKLDKR